MSDRRLSADESLRWIEWAWRVRWLVLGGACIVPLAAAVLVGLELPPPRLSNVALLVASAAAPLVLMAMGLLKTLSVARAMAGALRVRERQLAGTGASTGLAATAPAQRGDERPLGAGFSGDLRDQLQLVASNLPLLSEALADMMPVLDEYDATGHRLRIARLDYRFFRDRLPVVLRDLESAVGRIGAVLRCAPSPTPARIGRSPISSTPIPTPPSH